MNGRTWPSSPTSGPASPAPSPVGEGHRPCADGTVIYLNCDGRIDQVLARVEKAGGSIVEPKNHIPNVGWVAQIYDSEGNRVGLHAAA